MSQPQPARQRSQREADLSSESRHGYVDAMGLGLLGSAEDAAGIDRP
jgi:hypothetical protein